MGAYGLGDALLRNPITGMPGCCARAVSGQAIAAPPMSVMNSRRLNRSNGIWCSPSRRVWQDTGPARISQWGQRA
jgi:hypothetical protein